MDGEVDEEALKVVEELLTGRQTATTEAHRNLTADTLQDLVVRPKTVEVTETESDIHVEDQGEVEAEDETKQDSKEDEKDATMEVEENDIGNGSPGLTCSWRFGGSSTSERFPTHEDLRNEVLAYAGSADSCRVQMEPCAETGRSPRRSHEC